MSTQIIEKIANTPAELAALVNSFLNPSFMQVTANDMVDWMDSIDEDTTIEDIQGYAQEMQSDEATDRHEAKNWWRYDI